MKKKIKIHDKDIELLNQIAEECYEYFPFGTYTGYMALMRDIINHWPKRKLTTSKQSIEAFKFGFYSGFLSSQMFHGDITRERQIIKDFLRADKTAQIRLKEKLEREKLAPDLTTGI